MRFLNPEHDQNLELSLDEVFLVPGYFDGSSRLDVDLVPDDFPGGSHPVVSANMNAVTGKRMAETMARFGGLGVLPQDMDSETVTRIVAHIKAADPRFDTPLSVHTRATFNDIQGIIRKRSHDLVVVVDADKRPIGIVTGADLRGRDQYTPVEHCMSRRLVTVPAATTPRDAFLLLTQERIKAAPVVDAEGRLCGVLTRDDVVRAGILDPALDGSSRLMVAAAVGISNRVEPRVERLLDAGVDALVLDTAHGHQRRMIDALKAIRKIARDRIPIVAGNVCTAEGTRDLIEAGADIVKVNVGPGAMCTTRMQTGVGRPTFSSVLACANEARKLGRHVWADGGVRQPRDVALYLAAGASRVMVGTWLSGTFESPGDIQSDSDGRLYKENYGMASARAVNDRNIDLDPFEAATKGFFQEGVSTSRIYLRSGRESVGSILTEIITGLLSAFTYVGAKDLPTFHARAVLGVQSAAGYLEGPPRTAFD